MLNRKTNHRSSKPVTAGRTATTAELEVGGVVALKGGEWDIVAVDGDTVTVERNGIRKSTSAVTVWTYHAPIESVYGPAPVGSEATGTYGSADTSTDDLITSQEYLRAIGMPEVDLQDGAKVFGTVLMKLYRERHGKDARPVKKLEYVPYLDINGMEAQSPNDQAPKHLRVRANGWYESNAFTVDDIDLMDEVRAHRCPSLPTLESAVDHAIAVALEHGLTDVQPALDIGDRRPVELIWLVDKAVKECLATGKPCGHTECSRRRARQTRRIELEDWS